MLIKRALLIPNIIYAPQQRQLQHTTPQAQPINNTVILNSTKSSFNTNADNIRERRAESMGRSSQTVNGNVYVFCDPFSTEGTIVSWTFAARRQQRTTRVNLEEGAQFYPQLLILHPKIETGSHPCDAIAFNKASMTMICNPPILLETLNMYEVDVDLVYKRGDVLGVFQPTDSQAALLLAFVKAELNNSTAALRLEANLASNQITVGVNAEIVSIKPLMTFSATKSNTEPSNEPSLTTSRSDEEKPTPPETPGKFCVSHS